MILKYTLGHYPVHAWKSHLTTIAEEQTEQTVNEQKHVNTIQKIKTQWNEYGSDNKGTGNASLTFYFSLISIMKIPSAFNILQVGCGTGKLIPLAIMLKKQTTTYLGTDLTDNMIQSTKNNLLQNFHKYQSLLTFEQWCQKQKLSFKVANGEQIIQPKIKFDRIICNCVLMITQNPHKMLQSLFNQAEKGCLLGISVWGDKEKNPILKFITQLLKEQSDQQNARDQFHLYKKVQKIAEKIGWKLILQWQQNSIVPILDLDIRENDNDFKKTLKFFTNYLPESKKANGEQRIKEKAKELFDKKEGMNFWTELYIFEKPY